MSTKVLTIVFTDIKEFTQRTASADRHFVVDLLERQDRLLRPIVRRYDGQVVKTIGDALLITFESPTNAVLCALMMQETLADHNQGVPEGERIEIRVAINTGEVNVLEQDVLGEPVNVASRLESITEANEIYFTEATYLAMNKQEVPNSLVGEFRLKGVPEALKVYRVVRDTSSASYRDIVATQRELLRRPESSGTSTIPGGGSTMRQMLVAGLIIATLGLGIWWLAFAPPSIARRQDEARRAITSGHPDLALPILDDLLQRQPPDAVTSSLIEEAVKLGTRIRLEREGIDAAERYFADSRRRYAFLGELRAEQATLAAGRAQALIEAGRREEAQALVDGLLANWPNDQSVLLPIARFYGRTGVNWRQSVSLLFAAARSDPGHLATDPLFLKEIDYFIRKVGPDYGYQNEREFIGAHFLDQVRPILEPALYQPGEEQRPLRWNARSLLAKHTTIDDVRFYLAELLSPGVSMDSELGREAIEFFVREATLGRAETRARIPARLEAFPLLDARVLEDGSPGIDLAAGLFADALQTWLKTSLVDGQNHERRINAARALANAGRLATPAAALYHGTNLVSLITSRRHDLRPQFEESLDWIGQHGYPIGNADIFTDPSNAESIENLGRRPPTTPSRAECLVAVDTAISVAEATEQNARASGDFATARILSNLLARYRRVSERLKQPDP